MSVANAVWCVVIASVLGGIVMGAIIGAGIWYLRKQRMGAF